MTKVRVQAVEVSESGEEVIILDIVVREFTSGAQFGEASEAVNFAQKVVKAAGKVKG